MSESLSSKDIQVIEKLCEHLKANGDNFAKGKARLSLSTQVLHSLNLFLKNCPDNSDLKLKCDLIKDVFVKTCMLKIFNEGQSIQGGVELQIFSNLESLELRKIPLHIIVGLHAKAPQIQTLISSHNSHTLKELLTSPRSWKKTHWSSLQNLSVLHCDIPATEFNYKIPNLVHLDLSHNNISKFSISSKLRKLKHINLSYNWIRSMPTFSSSIKSSLTVLLLKYNDLSELNGLSELPNLIHLDLSDNCLCVPEVLQPLKTLDNLKKLALEGNPLMFLDNARLLVVPYLHYRAATTFEGFVLDNQVLTTAELMKVQLPVSTPSNDDPESHLAPRITVSPSRQNVVVESKYKGNGDGRKKKNISSEIVEVSEPPLTSPPQKIPSYDYLEIKEKIENMRKTYGSSWLVSSSITSINANIHSSPESSTHSSPKDNKLRNCNRSHQRSSAGLKNRSPLTKESASCKKPNTSMNSDYPSNKNPFEEEEPSPLHYPPEKNPFSEELNDEQFESKLLNSTAKSKITISREYPSDKNPFASDSSEETSHKEEKNSNIRKKSSNLHKTFDPKLDESHTIKSKKSTASIKTQRKLSQSPSSLETVGSAPSIIKASGSTKSREATPSFHQSEPTRKVSRVSEGIEVLPLEEADIYEQDLTSSLVDLPPDLIGPEIEEKQQGIEKICEFSERKIFFAEQDGDPQHLLLTFTERYLIERHPFSKKKICKLCLKALRFYKEEEETRGTEVVHKVHLNFETLYPEKKKRSYIFSNLSEQKDFVNYLDCVLKTFAENNGSQELYQCLQCNKEFPQSQAIKNIRKSKEVEEEDLCPHCQSNMVFAKDAPNTPKSSSMSSSPQTLPNSVSTPKTGKREIPKVISSETPTTSPSFHTATKSLKDQSEAEDISIISETLTTSCDSIGPVSKETTPTPKLSRKELWSQIQLPEPASDFSAKFLMSLDSNSKLYLEYKLFTIKETFIGALECEVASSKEFYEGYLVLSDTDIYLFKGPTVVAENFRVSYKFKKFTAIHLLPEYQGFTLVGPKITYTFIIGDSKTTQEFINYIQHLVENKGITAHPNFSVASANPEKLTTTLHSWLQNTELHSGEESDKEAGNLLAYLHLCWDLVKFEGQAVSWNSVAFIVTANYYFVSLFVGDDLFPRPLATKHFSDIAAIHLFGTGQTTTQVGLHFWEDPSVWVLKCRSKSSLQTLLRKVEPLWKSIFNVRLPLIQASECSLCSSISFP